MIAIKKLDNKKLKEILRKINTDPQTREQYASKLSRILKFLNNNTGLKNAGVKPGGSRGKQTDTRKSDLDIIFCTSKNQNHATIRNQVFEKAKEALEKLRK